MIHNKYYEIMKQFLGDYSRKIYGRELIDKVNISQKNIALTLNCTITSLTRGSGISYSSVFSFHR